MSRQHALDNDLLQYHAEVGHGLNEADRRLPESCWTERDFLGM